MHELRIEVRFKNAILWNALEAAFAPIGDALKLYHGPRNIMGTAAKAMQVPKHTLSDFLNLRVSPWDFRWNRVTRKPTAEVIAEYLGIEFDVLFPLSLYGREFPRLLTQDVEAAQFVALTSREAMQLLEASPDERRKLPDVKAALGRLPEKEREVLWKRFGFDDGQECTLLEAGEAAGIKRSIERIRQIEQRGLVRLRKDPQLRREIRQC